MKLRFLFKCLTVGGVLLASTQNLHAQDPTIVTCGGDPVDETYCYVNNDSHTWHWQSSTGLPLSLAFSSGSIESATWDDLRIYDGPDNTGNLIYEHVMTSLENLSGLQVIAPSGDIYMEMTADGSNSCESGYATSWVWQIGCLDCTPATATYSVTSDCDNFQFSVVVDITELGTDPNLDITNNGGAPTVTATAAGVYTVGPFTANIPVIITLENSDNSICSVHSAALVNPICPTPIVCGDPAMEYTFCYHNYMDSTMVYQGTGSYAIALLFNDGQMESCCDNITIYDGLDATAAVLYTGNNGGANMGGIMAISTNDDHALTVVFHSDVSVNCGDNGYPQLDWTVACLDCVAPVATYVVNTDCDAQNFTIDVDVSVLGSDSLLDITNDFDSTMVTTATDTGVYTVGPFPITTEVIITLANDSNSLCSIHSPVLTNPLCATHVTCGEPALEESYCYSNSDFHNWHWQNTDTAGTLALYFTSGSIAFPGAFGDNITVYDGPDNSGAILFQNTAAIILADTMIQSTGPDIYMELNSLNSTFSSCDDGNQTLWNWLVGCHDCAEPVATYQVVTDCAAQNFTVDVHLTDLGSQSLVELTNDVDSVIVTASDTGTYAVGPFPITTLVTITVQNDTNSLCNVHSLVLTNPLCPTFIVCGDPALDLTYCYTNYDSHAWHWQSSDGSSALSILFSAGTIESSNYDDLRIYNGPDNASPLLFEHTITSQENLAGYQFTASSGDIYMEMTSDGSSSCSSASQTEWAWQVGCLDCTPPEATFTVNTDCDAQNFTIDVDVSVLGSDSALNITNDIDSMLVVTATDTGVWTVGPFPITTEVTLTLENDSNSLCNLVSDMLTNPLCPTFVTCGEPALEESYCYSNSDFHAWHWQNTDGGTLAMYFSSGSIAFPGTFGDNLTIYDGPDNQGTILYQNAAQVDLSDLFIQSSGPDIYMELSSVNSTFSSCADGNQSLWNWLVGCMDCTAPSATYTVVTDCDAMQYSVVVDIDTMGSDPVIDITNDNGVTPVPASAVGTYTVGPFPAGSSTTVTLVNDMNSLCNVHSTVLTNPLCPTILECGADPVTVTYCYTNYDIHAWHWQCACGSPLSMQFSSGSIESNTWDDLTIYDGPDNNSPILFQHGSGTEDLSSILLISTGSDIYMEMSSDGSNSCSSGYADEWTWTVGCLDCTNPEATFSVVPDCQHATYQVAVNVASTGSSSTVRIASTASADTLENVPAGITLVGPIPMDSVASLTVLNATNGLCRVFSPEENAPFADCIIPVNGAMNISYCYSNTDTSYFAYQCTDDMPIAITFHAGQLLVNDYVQIYDSAGVSDNVLVFQGNLNGDMTGYSINSTNPQHALVMRVVSDNLYSCASGDAAELLNWTVECGYAGIEEESAGNFTMYPNPATSELYMRLPSDTHGSTEVRILDVSGRVAYRNTFTAAGTELNTFDLHGLQSGNYSVVVTTPNWVKAQNLQIIR